MDSANESGKQQAQRLEPKSPPFLQTFWDGLVADPDSGIAIIQIDGQLLYVNEAGLLFWTPSGEPKIVYEGRTVHQVLPVEMADHVMHVTRTVIETRKTLVDRTIWRGKQLMTTARFLEPPPGELPRILSVTRHAPTVTEPGEQTGPFEFVESGVADFGKLNVLTAREIEVLALIGQGLRISDIAKTLHRSPKTIESHRNSIGSKLFGSGANRVDLAKLVFEAGLRLDDAKLQRADPYGPRHP